MTVGTVRPTTGPAQGTGTLVCKMTEDRAHRPDGRTARRERTRDRIVEATIALHTTVGPARTSISAIAERAGVERHTVYSHFPDTVELFRACSGRWQSRNPFPDPDAWTSVRGRDRRVGIGLTEVYGFYERTHRELSPVLAGAEDVPAMAESLRAWNAWLDKVTDTLAGSGRATRPEALWVGVRHALELGTWQSLCLRGGLGREEAVALMRSLVVSASRMRPVSVPGPT
jgi:AcrR family transcriptional regulator